MNRLVSIGLSLELKGQRSLYKSKIDISVNAKSSNNACPHRFIDHDWLLGWEGAQ